MNPIELSFLSSYGIRTKKIIADRYPAHPPVYKHRLVLSQLLRKYLSIVTDKLIN
jgi:hypothetical protein